MRLIRRALGWLVALVDDILRLPPDQRGQRDRSLHHTSEEVAHRRQLRLKLHLLEKRGKGGYR